MTPLQISVLWNCAQPNGVDANWTEVAGRSRQTSWLLNRGMIRKRKGRFVATRNGKKILLYQCEGWETTPETTLKPIRDSLRRRSHTPHRRES